VQTKAAKVVIKAVFSLAFSEEEERRREFEREEDAKFPCFFYFILHPSIHLMCAFESIQSSSIVIDGYPTVVIVAVAPSGWLELAWLW